DHTADALKQNKERMNAAPGPRRIDRRRMIVNILRPERSDEAMMDRHIGDREQVRHPVLIERQKDQHDEKMKMEFDKAAGEVNENGGRTDQSETDGRRPQRAAQPGAR